ncbi:MAG: hypothetical protein ACJAX5_002707 [Patiriisocius sp.]|jgi:hypothetical protein
MRHDFHTHPELGNCEFKTAEKIAVRLRQLGFDQVTTGVVGILKGNKPVVQRKNGLSFCLKGDNGMARPRNRRDARLWPRCSYGDPAWSCGSVVGMRDQTPGTVKFIFQPAEGYDGHIRRLKNHF